MGMETLALAFRHFSSLSLKVMTGIFPPIFLVHYSSLKNWSRASIVFALSPIAGFLGALIFRKFIDGNVPLIAQ